MNMGTASTDRKTFYKEVHINAPASRVWHILTTPELMKKWMMPDIELTIVTDWGIGNPITIYGNMNGKNFENKGLVLKFDPEKTLQYTHLSSISRLPDRPENHAIFEFQLQPVEDQTILKFTLSNLPTDSVDKHLTFYWNITLEILKKSIEEQRI